MKMRVPGYDVASFPLLSIHDVPGTWHILPRLILTTTLQNRYQNEDTDVKRANHLTKVTQIENSHSDTARLHQDLPDSRV